METRERLAARTLVLTPERRVLLIRFRSPWRGADIWITPGGSLKCEEDARDAARRKLREETGFQLNHVGPELWTRDHDLSSHGVPILQRERYFLVQVEEFVPWADSLEVGEEKDWLVFGGSVGGRSMSYLTWPRSSLRGDLARW